MNLLPNSSQRLDPSRDLLQTAPSAWMVHSHNSSVMPWPSQPLPLGSLYFAHQQSFHRPPANLGPMHPMHSGQHGTLPHPDRNMRGLQNPESVHGLPSGAVYWGSPLQPTPGMPGLTASMHSSGTGMMSTGPSAVTSVGGFGNSNTNTRDLALRPPTALDWASSAATSGTHSVSPSHLSFSEGLSQTPGQQFGSQTTVPAFPLSPVSPRRPGQSSSPPSYRSHRSQPRKFTTQTLLPPRVWLYALYVGFTYLLSGLFEPQNTAKATTSLFCLLLTEANQNTQLPLAWVIVTTLALRPRRLIVVDKHILMPGAPCRPVNRVPTLYGHRMKLLSS